MEKVRVATITALEDLVADQPKRSVSQLAWTLGDKTGQAWSVSTLRRCLTVKKLGPRDMVTQQRISGNSQAARLRSADHILRRIAAARHASRPRGLPTSRGRAVRGVWPAC